MSGRNSTLKPGKPPQRRAGIKQGCGKVRYRDEIAAKMALARVQREDGSGRPKSERRAYFHTACGGWHLTSMRGTGTRPAKARRPGAKRLAAGSSPARKAARDAGFSAKVKLLVRTRAGNGDPEQATCEACGIHLGLHGGQVQHIYARQNGGTKLWLYQSAANAALLCGTPFTGDHGLCEARDPHMKEAGFWRERNGKEKPGDYPIMLHGQGGGRLAWLTPEGGYADQAPMGGAA